jgi:hypothetical protein
MPTNYTDDATSTVAHYFLEPNLLVVALCNGKGPPAWVISVDLMLDKITISLVMSQPRITPVPGCLLATTTASEKVQAPLVDSCSLLMAPQCTTDSPPLSPKRDTPPQMGQAIVAGVEAPREDGEV